MNIKRHLAERDYRSALLVCVLLVAVALMFVVTSGCSSPTIPDDPEWSEDYNAPWAKVVSCWQDLGYDTSRLVPPFVEIHDGCLTARNGYGYWEYAPGEYCYGYYHEYRKTAEVCPDLAALGHEFAHHASKVLTGTTDPSHMLDIWRKI